MKQTQEQLGILASQIATYSGRDGDDSFQMEIRCADIPWDDPAFRQPAVKLMCKALLHLTGATKFSPLPTIVDAKELADLVIAFGDSGGGSRFKVTAKDTQRAKDVLKGYEMAPEQTVAQFEEKYGKPFVADLAVLEEHYKNVRAAASKPMGV